MKKVLRAKIHTLPVPSGNYAMRAPYIVIHSPKTRGMIYLLLSQPNISHANMAEDLGQDPKCPNIVGGGHIQFSPDGTKNVWDLEIVAGSHYGCIPANVQKRFATLIKRYLGLMGVKINRTETRMLDGSHTNVHWEDYADCMINTANTNDLNKRS